MLSAILQQSHWLILVFGSLAILLLFIFLRGYFSPILSLSITLLCLLALHFQWQKVRKAMDFSFNTEKTSQLYPSNSTGIKPQPGSSFLRNATTNPALPEEPATPLPNIPTRITLQLDGLSDPSLTEALSKHLGIQFDKKGDFVISVGYTGNILESENPLLGKKQFNYSKGWVILDVDGMPCIRQGEYALSQTQYEGYDLWELREDLKKRKTEILLTYIQRVAFDLKICLLPLLQ